MKIKLLLVSIILIFPFFMEAKIYYDCFTIDYNHFFYLGTLGRINNATDVDSNFVSLLNTNNPSKQDDYTLGLVNLVPKSGDLTVTEYDISNLNKSFSIIVRTNLCKPVDYKQVGIIFSYKHRISNMKRIISISSQDLQSTISLYFSNRIRKWLNLCFLF